MSFKRSTRLSVALIFLMSSINVHAETNRIVTINDWSLFESTNNQQTTCFIEANDLIPDGSGSSSLTTMFRVVKVKNSPNSPVELMMLLAQNKKNNTGTVAKISDAVQMGFSDMDGTRSSFWGIPTNLTNFLNNLTTIDELKTRAIGGKDKVKGSIPIRGYKDILREMENRCNGGLPLVSTEFDQFFISQIPDGIDPTKLDSTKTIALRAAYHSAYKALYDISETKKELAQLLAKYQSLIDQLDANRATTKQIQTVLLPEAQSDLNIALNNQELAKAELARIEALIPDLKAKIEVSQKILDDARAILAPLVPEHDRLSGGLNAAQNILSESQSRLNYIETRLSNGAQQLNSLRSEANSIESSLPQKRNDLNYALDNYHNAQSRRAAYNPTWEKDSQLRNNSEYNQLQNNRQHLYNDLRQTEVDLERNQNERDRIARDLQYCRNQPINGDNSVEKLQKTNSIAALLSIESLILAPGGGGPKPQPQPQPRPTPPPQPQPQPRPTPPPQPQPQPRPTPPPQPQPQPRPTPPPQPQPQPRPTPPPQPQPQPRPTPPPQPQPQPRPTPPPQPQPQPRPTPPPQPQPQPRPTPPPQPQPQPRPTPPPQPQPQPRPTPPPQPHPQPRPTPPPQPQPQPRPTPPPQPHPQPTPPPQPHPQPTPPPQPHPQPTPPPQPHPQPTPPPQPHPQPTPPPQPHPQPTPPPQPHPQPTPPPQPHPHPQPPPPPHPHPQPPPPPHPHPQPPPPPHPHPRPDCSYLERSLDSAESQVRQNEYERRNLIQRIDEVNSRISRIEQQIDWDVRQEYDRLVSYEDQARREYDNLNNSISNDESRLSQIRNVDIPRLESEQNSLLNERPTVIARIDQAQSDVNRLTQELSTFETANDWKNKLASVNSAQRQLQNDQAQLDLVMEQKRQAQLTLDKNVSLAQLAQEKITSLNAQLGELAKQANDLTEALKNLPAERAPLDSKIAALQLSFENLRTKFLDLLK